MLKAAGYDVTLPERTLCCGRPLYDYGMLDAAKRRLAQVLRTVGPDVRAGKRIVVLEPSCASVIGAAAAVVGAAAFVARRGARGRLSSASSLLGWR